MKIVRHLLAIACLTLAGIAAAAPAYVNSVAYSGPMPYTTAGYTPGAAGRQIYLFGFTNSTSDVFSLTGSATTLTNIPVSSSADFGDGHGNTYTLWGNLSAASGSQTFTFGDTATGYLRTGLLFEFSGGLSTGSPVYTTTASPGAGAGGVAGAAVTVASGDILVFICVNGDYFGSAPTLYVPGTATAGATHANVASWYYTGTGASVTPSCTGATGDTTTPHNLVQYVVSASAANTYGPVQPKFTPFMTGYNLPKWRHMAGANDDLYIPRMLKEPRRAPTILILAPAA